MLLKDKIDCVVVKIGGQNNKENKIYKFYIFLFILF